MAVQIAVMSSNVRAMLHPFFTKPTDRQCGNVDDDSSVGHNATRPNERQQRSKVVRKSHPKNQPTIGQLFGRGTEHDVPPEQQDDNDVAEFDTHARKRRRTSLDSFVDAEGQDSSQQSQELPEGLYPVGDLDTELSKTGNEPHPSTPGKKMLKLNARGRFSSPISKTSANTGDAGSENVKRRGRPRKAKELAPEKHLIVILRYPTTTLNDSASTTAHKIEQIMAGELSITVHKKPQSTKKIRTPRKQMKPTHPFFDGKKRPVSSVVIASPRKMAATTPGKLRSQARQEREEVEIPFIPASESALLKDRLMVKHPGSKEPLWPAKGMNHIRDLPPTTQAIINMPGRKQKHHLPIIEDSLLSQYMRQLIPEPEPQLRPDGYHEPRADLRVPNKLLLSGVDIATSISREVRAPLLDGLDDELAPNGSQSTVHPALEAYFGSISAHLSAFDMFRGDTQSWAQKSAPQCTEHILQPLSEMNVIRSWLQSLAINTVDVRKEHDGIHVRKKKRKTRPDDLNDFIVDEDDDVRSLGNISDADGPSSQSVVQNQIEGLHASNTMLISGPHGCGKTAAVYAIAKELHYRVFEISSSERRSGKDVLDKIGNVTENHIVKGHVDTDAELSGCEDKERIDAAFKQDLESGRQGKMSAFFKPKPMHEKKPAAVVKAKVIENVRTAIKKATKEQQQSLILLEEVDILYKVDKEFWSTILKLVQTSKRPFIMTCNDEDLVPIQAIDLHAVLRLVTPSAELAIDYLLLVAAKEGHLLKRKAVSSLWKDCRHDLRRSLTTLDFWCRMGVGDIRDGLGWIYQRWPAGSDLDAKGRPLRVVSQHTYQEGMSSDIEQVKHKSHVTLSDACRAADARSDVDVFTTTQMLDTTQPEMPDRRRQHYIEGLTLLDAPEVPDFTGLRHEIAETALHYVGGEASYENGKNKLTRTAFAAYDVLAYPATSTGMEWSVLDGPLTSIVIDVAPYIRQVIRYEIALRNQREAVSGPVKKARTTRAARSALEGGQRQLTRRDEWWDGSADMYGVLSTAGEHWHECVEPGE